MLAKTKTKPLVRNSLRVYVCIHTCICIYVFTHTHVYPLPLPQPQAVSFWSSQAWLPPAIAGVHIPPMALLPTPRGSVPPHGGMTAVPLSLLHRPAVLLTLLLSNGGWHSTGNATPKNSFNTGMEFQWAGTSGKTLRSRGALAQTIALAQPAPPGLLLSVLLDQSPLVQRKLILGMFLSFLLAQLLRRQQKLIEADYL